MGPLESCARAEGAVLCCAEKAPFFGRYVPIFTALRYVPIFTALCSDLPLAGAEGTEASDRLCFC